MFCWLSSGVVEYADSSVRTAVSEATSPPPWPPAPSQTMKQAPPSDVQ
jgi:hypothetical protein